VPSPDDRFQYIIEYIQQGDPNAVQAQVENLTRASKQLEAAASGAASAQSEVSRATERMQQQHAAATRTASELSSALREATNATYLIGMGAMWSGIPMTGFIANAGNMLNGVLMMSEGFQTLSRSIPLLTITSTTIAVTALGTAMVVSARAAQELVGRIRNLSEITGLTISDTARMVNQFTTLFGPQGATGAVTAIAQGQANVGILQLMQEMSAARAAQQLGPGQVFMPQFADVFARFGIARFAPGSTPQQPIPLPPDEVLFNVALDVLRRRTPGQRQQEINLLGPQVGGVDVLMRLVRELERGEQRGIPPEQTFAQLRGTGFFGFTPGQQDIENLDRFTTAQNELANAFLQLKAQVGSGLLPAFTEFIRGLTDFLRVLNAIVAGIREFVGWIGPVGPILQSVAHVVGFLVVPAIIALAAVLIGALFPAIGAVTAALLPWLGILAGIIALVAALGLGFSLLADPTKRFIDGLGGFGGLWKSLDWANMAAQVKQWADMVVQAFVRALTALQAFLDALVRGLQLGPIVIVTRLLPPEIPEIRLPELEWPIRFRLPPLPEIRLPDLVWPSKIRLPDLPDLKLPELEWLTKLKIPPIEDLKLPELEWITRLIEPPIPDLRLPELYWLTRLVPPPIPDLRLPELEWLTRLVPPPIPDLRLPELEWLTRLRLPEVPDLRLPELDWPTRIVLPQIPPVELPILDWFTRIIRPEIPGVQLPILDWFTQIIRPEIPGVQLPILDWFTQIIRPEIPGVPLPQLHWPSTIDHPWFIPSVDLPAQHYPTIVDRPAIIPDLVMPYQHYPATVDPPIVVPTPYMPTLHYRTEVDYPSYIPEPSLPTLHYPSVVDDPGVSFRWDTSLRLGSISGMAIGAPATNIAISISALDIHDQAAVQRIAQAVSDAIARNLRVMNGVGRVP
jgi:hypothetical protein